MYTVFYHIFVVLNGSMNLLYFYLYIYHNAERWDLKYNIELNRNSYLNNKIKSTELIFVVFPRAYLREIKLTVTI